MEKRIILGLVVLIVISLFGISFVYAENKTSPVCGNGVCEENEVGYPTGAPHLYYCPKDCNNTSPICGNGICEQGENGENCLGNACDRCTADCKDESGDENENEKDRNKSDENEDLDADDNENESEKICEDYRYSNCSDECGKKCIPSSCTQGLNTICTDDCDGIGSCFTISKNKSDEKLPGEGKIKILPETASLRAQERLGELGFNVSLKEVGKGNETKTFYDISGEKEGKMFGLFKIKGKVSVEVDAETGEIIKVRKPWWSFLAGI